MPLGIPCAKLKLVFLSSGPAYSVLEPLVFVRMRLIILNLACRYNPFERMAAYDATVDVQAEHSIAYVQIHS